MAANPGLYCGTQYKGKGCSCLLQVTPGYTPTTQSAANATYVCAYQENGIQYGCDAGCCYPNNPCTAPTTTTPATDTTTTDATSPVPQKMTWVDYLLIAFGILYALIIAGAVAYVSSRK